MTLALPHHILPVQAHATPLRRAMRLQVWLTLVALLVSGLMLGLHGAASALLGGAISVSASAVFTWVIGRNRSLGLTDTLVSMLVAEAAKVGVIIVGLLAAFLLYTSAVGIVLVGTFIVTTLAFAGAAFMAPTQPSPADTQK